MTELLMVLKGNVFSKLKELDLRAFGPPLANGKKYSREGKNKNLSISFGTYGKLKVSLLYFYILNFTFI